MYPEISPLTKGAVSWGKKVIVVRCFCMTKSLSLMAKLETEAWAISCTLSIPPENIRKHLVYRCFRGGGGVQKVNSGMEWVNKIAKLQILLYL